MAQLSDDCFAFGGALMRADAASAILADRATPLAPVERSGLRNAVGRILAANIVAARSVPPHDNAAVDGYAVAFADLDPNAATRLPIVGRSAAGHPMAEPLRGGTAARVFTGAPMPLGADTVFMQEDVRVEGDTAILPPGLKRGSNRRKVGEDIAAGTTVLKAGHRLRAQDVGLIASLGMLEFDAYARLRVAVFSTGDELREPGAAAPSGTVYDANRFVLLAALDRLGFAVSDLGILADRPDAVREALADAAATHDAVITSGGMSMGAEDHVRAAVEMLGALHFWRLAIRPGRPVAFGTLAGKAFLGLPGNPVAMMVTFLRFARPVLLRLAGATDVVPHMQRVRIAADIGKKAGRREWLRVKLAAGDDGIPVAHKFPRDGAGILTSLVESDGLIELDEDTCAVPAGSLVDFLPYTEVAQ
jgi:molybdopterin molybdotransferase